MNSPELGFTAAATLKRTDKSSGEDWADKTPEFVPESGTETRRIYVVADGIGSSAHAGAASRFLVDFLTQELHADLPEGVAAHAQLHQTLMRAREAFREQLSKEGAEFTEYSHQTTVVAAVETAKTVTVFYLGNGAAYHLRGHQLLMPERMPWYTVNLLNPHSVPQGGKEVLTRYFSPTASDAQLAPGIVAYRKDPTYGDVTVLCTDGLGSQDTVVAGKSDAGTLYVPVNLVLGRLAKRLRGFAEAEQPTDAGLQQACEQLLRECPDERAEDDISVAVSVTKAAVDFIRRTAKPASPPDPVAEDPMPQAPAATEPDSSGEPLQEVPDAAIA